MRPSMRRRTEPRTTRPAALLAMFKAPNTLGCRVLRDNSEFKCSEGREHLRQNYAMCELELDLEDNFPNQMYRDIRGGQSSV